MRCSGWSSLAISVSSLVAVAALVLAPATAAHVIPSPAFVASGGTQKISLTFPNERQEPMTGFAIQVPDGLEIERAYPVAGWQEAIAGPRATWTGGALAPDATATFDVDIAAESEPGIVQLESEWLYEDTATVRWPVVLTVTPAEESPSQNLGLAAIVGGVGLVVALGVVLLARRRAKPRQRT